MLKAYGIKLSDWKKLGKIFNEMHAEPMPNISGLVTVAEYIKTHDVKTEYRTSKNGTELVKVYYPTGKIKEYELKRIDDATAFEY